MDEIIEIFGKKLKIVQDENNGVDYCDICAVEDECWAITGRMPFCEDAKGKINRHFEVVND